MKAQGNTWTTVEAGKSERQKGRVETARIQDLWIGLGLLPLCAERFSKLAIEGSNRKGWEDALTLLP